MRYFSLLLTPLLLASASASASATPTDDLAALEASSQSVADMLDASLNCTGVVNTSSLLQSVTSRISAAHVILQGGYNINITTTGYNNTTVNLNPAYLNFANSIGNLAESTLRRGRVPHGEQNIPVYDALDSLNSALHAYSSVLSSSRLISADSIIRTRTAQNYIQGAQAAWDQTGNTPGKFRAKVRRRSTVG